MRNTILVSLLFFCGGINTFAQQIDISMQIIDKESVGNSNTKAPHRPWYITQDDYVLTLPAMSDDCTLELLDEDGDVVYSTWLPVGTTSVVLPSTLSGEFELRLIPSGATYYYRGYIEL